MLTIQSLVTIFLALLKTYPTQLHLTQRKEPQSMYIHNILNHSFI